MIIDAILDRKDGCTYSKDKFCQYCKDEVKIFGMDYKIHKFIDDGDEEKAKAELCRYIDEQHYNPEIKNYINSVQWTEPLTDYDKRLYLDEYVTCQCYCDWGIFEENVGSTSEIVERLKECKTKKDIRHFVGEYI